MKNRAIRADWRREFEGALTWQGGLSISATMATANDSAPKSAVAVYSGGMDSTVMLYAMKAKGTDIRGAITIDYGQKHRKEIEAARSICADLGIEHQVADLRALSVLFGACGLVDSDTAVPEGHYEEDSMKQTVVPNRNMILISVATAWAITKQVEAVAYAAHSGDHAIYPDCRETFAQALDEAIQKCDWSSVRLYRPFVMASKADIVREGTQLGVPLERTWSCYKGGAAHCGKCGTCIERREAFHLSGVEDRTLYEPDAPSAAKLIDSDWHLPDSNA